LHRLGGCRIPFLRRRAFVDQRQVFLQRVEQLVVQQLILQLAVEGAGAAVLPRAHRLDAGGARTRARDPRFTDLRRWLTLHGLGDEYRPVVRAELRGRLVREIAG
jgi:hypothetical protein